MCTGNKTPWALHVRRYPSLEVLRSVKLFVIYCFSLQVVIAANARQWQATCVTLLSYSRQTLQVGDGTTRSLNKCRLGRFKFHSHQETSIGASERQPGDVNIADLQSTLTQFQL